MAKSHPSACSCQQILRAQNTDLVSIMRFCCFAQQERCTQFLHFYFCWFKSPLHWFKAVKDRSQAWQALPTCMILACQPWHAFQCIWHSRQLQILCGTIRFRWFALSLPAGCFLLAEGLKGIFWIVQTRATVTLSQFHLPLSIVTGAICWGSRHGAALETKTYNTFYYTGRMTGLLIATGDIQRTITAQLTPNSATTTGGWNNYLISTLDQGNTLQSTTADQRSASLRSPG